MDKTIIMIVVGGTPKGDGAYWYTISDNTVGRNISSDAIILRCRKRCDDRSCEKKFVVDIFGDTILFSYITSGMRACDLRPGNFFSLTVGVGNVYDIKDVYNILDNIYNNKIKPLILEEKGGNLIYKTDKFENIDWSGVCSSIETEMSKLKKDEVEIKNRITKIDTIEAEVFSIEDLKDDGVVKEINNTLLRDAMVDVRSGVLSRQQQKEKAEQERKKREGAESERKQQEKEEKFKDSKVIELSNDDKFINNVITRLLENKEFIKVLCEDKKFKNDLITRLLKNKEFIKVLCEDKKFKNDLKKTYFETGERRKDTQYTTGNDDNHADDGNGNLFNKVLQFIKKNKIKTVIIIFVVLTVYGGLLKFCKTKPEAAESIEETQIVIEETPIVEENVEEDMTQEEYANKYRIDVSGNGRLEKDKSYKLSLKDKDTKENVNGAIFSVNSTRYCASIEKDALSVWCDDGEIIISCNYNGYTIQRTFVWNENGKYFETK